MSAADRQHEIAVLARGPSPARRRALVVTATLLIALSLYVLIRAPETTRGRAARPLAFSTPEGWVDLSPGTPALSVSSVPASLRPPADDAHLAHYAVDLRHVATEGYAAVFSADVIEGRGESARDALEAVLNNTVVRPARLAGSTVTVSEQGVVAIGGYEFGRFVATFDDGGGRPFESLGYVLPAGKNVALLTYLTALTHFSDYRPTFEASAARTIDAVRGL